VANKWCIKSNKSCVSLLIIAVLQGVALEMKVGKYLIIITFFISALVTFGDRGLIDNFRMKERLISVKRANYDLARENGELKRTISLLSNDLSYVEMVARNELGMVRKGTVVFQFDN
jgi:cell division protein FtsB